MKKLLTALAVVAAVGTASAVEVGVSAVRDYNVDKDGTRVTATVGKATVSATSINDVYNRYAVGTGVDLFTVGLVKVGATGAVVYQDTSGAGQDGYGVTAGLKASVPLAKNVDLTAGVERFVGQSRLNDFNGTVGTVGVAVRF
jgi:hypothetical protein